MKKLAFVFLLVQQVLALDIRAQKPTLNHLALYVTDLQQSTAFYHNLLGLDTVPEPFHDGRHTWLAMGPGARLHLIQGAASPTPQNRNTHLCFSVPAIAVFLKRLEKARHPYEDWAGKRGSVTTRVDGVRQVYFTDPDGYWIEINDAKE